MNIFFFFFFFFFFCCEQLSDAAHCLYSSYCRRLHEAERKERTAHILSALRLSELTGRSTGAAPVNHGTLE